MNSASVLVFHCTFLDPDAKFDLIRFLLFSKGNGTCSGNRIASTDPWCAFQSLPIRAAREAVVGASSILQVRGRVPCFLQCSAHLLTCRTAEQSRALLPVMLNQLATSPGVTVAQGQKSWRLLCDAFLVGYPLSLACTNYIQDIESFSEFWDLIRTPEDSSMMSS